MIIFIILLSILFLLTASIIWSTLWLGISPMPSTKKARQAMIALVEKSSQGPIYELGSGWGNIIIPLAIKYPKRTIVGYEYAWLPWLVTVLLKKILRLSHLTLHRKNFLTADLSDARVFMCYLSPQSMHALAQTLSTLNIKERYLISHNFALPAYKASETIQLTDFYRSPVYLYKL